MSRVLALVSLMFFAGALLTAVRARFLARMTGGLALQFRLHHILGWLAGLAFLGHIGWELWQAPPGFRKSLILTTDQPLRAGWLALFFFVLAFIFSYQRRLGFPAWRRWHLLFPLAFILALFHAQAFAPGTALDQTVILGAGMLGMIILAAILVGKIWNPHARLYRVHARHRVSRSTWELLLESKDKARSQQPCRAGQIIYVRFLQPGFTRALHPFSVASCRLERYLRLYIKSLGRDTSHLEDLALQSEVEVIGPFTELRLELDREQVWIGGGIGIAPFLGFLHCTQGLITPPLHILHFISHPDEILDNADINTLREVAPQLSWHNIVDKKGQPPQLGRLDAVLKSAVHPRIVVCGPNPFMRMVRHHLEQQGVPSQDIITEEFIL